MIIDELAELLYYGDSSQIPWDKALEDDRRYYYKTAELVVSAVADYLENENDAYSGALRLASQLLITEVEFSRLNRTRQVAT